MTAEQLSKESPPSQFDLSGRVAVVVGGSRGLGQAMSLGLARAGAEVMVVSRKIDACRAVSDKITAETGRRSVPFACHIGRWDEVDALADHAYETFGKVDILVNSAGIAPKYESVTSITETLYDNVLSVNLKGPFRLSCLVGSRMAAGEGGSIVFVSSVYSIRPTTDAIPYAAAKAGVNAITLGLAHALGPKVRVNCIMPGAFFTDISAHWDMAVVEESMQHYAMRRGAQPEEIVGTIVYLASQASSFTTGAVLRVDGGYP